MAPEVCTAVQRDGGRSDRAGRVHVNCNFFLTGQHRALCCQMTQFILTAQWATLFKAAGSCAHCNYPVALLESQLVLKNN